MALAALKAPLFEQEEPYLYHDVSRPGFAAVLQQYPDGRRRQRSFKLNELPEMLGLLYDLPDVWISQGEFYKPNRKVVNLWRMSLAYVDVDSYLRRQLGPG